MPWKDLLARVLCLAVGVMVASGLTEALKAPVQWTQERPVRTKVSVRAATKSVQEAPAAPVPPRPVAARPKTVLPLKAEAPPAPKPRVTAETPVAVETPEPPLEMLSTQPLPTLSQPALAFTASALVQTLPPVPGSDVPSAPAEPVAASSYPEQPGGPVLVLEVFVNDEGRVFDSRIVVPSANSLGDVSIALAIRGQKWEGLTPPLQPGETRRLELRIPYGATETGAPETLP